MREAVTGLAAPGLFGWLKARERKILLIATAAQVMILLAMTVLRAITLMTGQTVLVRVQPVIADLFRGDYVILSYDFSRVRPDSVEGLSEAERGRSWKNLEGRTVYVPLVPDWFRGTCGPGRSRWKSPLPACSSRDT